MSEKTVIPMDSIIVSVQPSTIIRGAYSWALSVTSAEWDLYGIVASGCEQSYISAFGAANSLIPAVLSAMKDGLLIEQEVKHGG